MARLSLYNILSPPLLPIAFSMLSYASYPKIIPTSIGTFPPSGTFRFLLLIGSFVAVVRFFRY